MNTFIAIPNSSELFAKLPISEEHISQSTPSHFTVEDFADDLSLKNNNHQKSTLCSESQSTDEIKEETTNQSRKLKRKVRLQNFEDPQTFA
mmetsp:Transcript_41087/g.36423  ORF Transcript_41087/g.36423 Transcript_41087/m.36423 type:complete len:91 (+) Transcript_41087:50-322(+)